MQEEEGWGREMLEERPAQDGHLCGKWGWPTQFKAPAVRVASWWLPLLWGQETWERQQGVMEQEWQHLLLPLLCLMACQAFLVQVQP